MMTEREIFEAALELTDAGRRQAYLDEACAGNPELRRQLEDLLNLHATGGDFLSTPAVNQIATSSPAIESGEGSASAGSVDSEQTQGYSPQTAGDDDEVSLGFLSPTEKPGSLGRLGHYEIHEVIGHGAFGIVLRAFDEKLHRIVAIKVMSSQLAATSPPRKRFLREARAAAAIRHENVVAVYAVEEQPIPYLVMEFIPGITVEQALKDHGPLDVPDVLRLGQQIASGLAAAHAQGLIHRDIKPSNILLENGLSGKVKITDFGLARAADDASVTQSGTIAGTPLYMSPEQATSRDIDQRSDLFSLGSVLYVMVSGRPPFRAQTTLGVLKRVVEDMPRSIREIIADTPNWLCAIISKLQAKQPHDRFATAHEVAELLGKCLADLQANRPVQLPANILPAPVAAPHEPITLAPASRQPDVSKPKQRNVAHDRRWQTIAAAALIVLVGLGLTEATGVTQLASTVIRLSTGSGTLVIETDDPGVKVTIDGEEVRIQGAGVEQLSLKPGQYQIAAVKNGKSVSQQLVTITRGGREVVRVTLEGNGTVATASTRKNSSGWHGWPADAPPPAIAPFDAEQAKQHQAAWAKYLGVPVEYTNSIGMKFRLIPPGEFMMGSTPEEIEESLEIAGENPDWLVPIQSEGPRHKVILTQPIYLSVYETTQAVYEKVIGKNPSYFSKTGPDKQDVERVEELDTAEHPVEGVNWKDAAEFCVRLSENEKLKPSYSFRDEEAVRVLDGTGYRLPTEAEWEFACRGGTTTKFWIGDSDESLSKADWFDKNSRRRTHPVGELKGNPFDLYDIHGNVSEWVQDRWDPTYYAEFTEKPAINPSGPFPGDRHRIKRGDNWKNPAAYHRASNRLGVAPMERVNHIGFRVALPVDAVRPASKIDGTKSVKPGAPVGADGNPVAERGRSAWDDLDPAQIPEAERVPDQPKELVAVLGEHRQRHAGFGLGVSNIVIRPDGKQFVSIAADGLRFWDAATFQQTSHFRPKGYTRSAAAYLSGGTRLIVGGESNSGQIWNLDENGIKDDPPIALPVGAGKELHSRYLVVSPDERWLIRGKEQFTYRLSLMSLADSSPKIVAEYPDCRFAAFSPNNRLLAILRDDDKTIRILELGEGAPVERHLLKTESEANADRPSKGFQQMVFLSDGRLATADNNGHTWFWNLTGSEPQNLFSIQRADRFMHAAQQATIIGTSESGLSAFLRIDADQAVVTLRAIWMDFPRSNANLTSFAIFPNGRTVVTGHLNGAIRFWDITGEKAVEKHPIAVQPAASSFVDLAVLHGVIVTRDEESNLRLWQPTSNGLVEHPATKSEEAQKHLPVTASRDGRLLVTRPIWEGPGCTLWQWDGQKLTPVLGVGRSGAWSAALSSDDRRLAIGYRGTVDLWDITARPPRLEKTVKATDANGAAYQTAFANNDSLLIARMGTVLKSWDLDMEEPPPEKVIAGLEPFQFAVSPTQDLLAADGVQLLDLRQIPAQPLITLQSGLGQNGTLAFSSDGKQLAVADSLSAYSQDRFVIDVYDIESRVRRHRITVPMRVRRVSFTEDNRHLISVNGNGTVYVLRLQ